MRSDDGPTPSPFRTDAEYRTAVEAVTREVQAAIAYRRFVVTGEMPPTRPRSAMPLRSSLTLATSA